MATLTITVPDELLATFQRFQQENGTNWADSFVEDKLKEIKGRHLAVDGKVLEDAFLVATKADQDNVKSILKIATA